MARHPRFFNKNYMDLDVDGVTVTVTDSVASENGNSFVDYIRNRNNRSAWITTDSTDAALTQIDVEWTDEIDCSRIFLVGMNFRSYTIQYWNGSSYTDFPTAINETTNIFQVKLHEFTQISTTKIRLIINGTFAANDDKFLYQMIVTDELGEFETGFYVDALVVAQERKVTKMISGKSKITRNLGSFMCSFKKNNVTSGNDIALIESLYGRPAGFLMWLCGGEESQFRTRASGYRKEDIFLMDFKSEYKPQLSNGFNDWGLDIKIDLVEIV